jgi:hypothetical protein
VFHLVHFTFKLCEPTHYLSGEQNPIHQQFWRYLHFMCRTNDQNTVVFFDQVTTMSGTANNTNNKDASGNNNSNATSKVEYVLKVSKLKDGHTYGHFMNPLSHICL